MVSHDAKATVDYAASKALFADNAADTPLLSVVIVNYKSKGLLKYCLKRFFERQLPFATEVIVVDNASNDGSDAMVHTLFPHAQFLPLPSNKGFAAGNNAGIARARGHYVLIMNPDIVVREGALQELCNFLDTHPNVAAVGPCLLNPDGTVQDSRFRFPNLSMPLYRRTPLGRFSFARRAIAQYCMADVSGGSAHAVPWLLGACICVRRDAIARVGPMDERFFLYFEDIDWCRRFWVHGYEVWYEPKAVLTHFHQRLSAEATGLAAMFSRATRAHIVSYFKYFLKWGAKPHYE